jgi:hypothetical protein
MADLHSRWLHGNLLYYDTYLHRIVGAQGLDVYHATLGDKPIPLDDTTGDPTIGTMTVVETGTGTSTLTAANQSGGGFLITTDDADNDGVNFQLHGESFKLASTVSCIYFGAFGVTINEVTQSDLFIGLSITDTDILGGATDSIGFRCVDASASLTYLLEKDSTETSAAAATIVDATAFDAEFFFDGTQVEFFYNGASVVKSSTNMPDDEEMRLSIHFLNGLANSPATCQVERLTAIQVGR